MRFSPTQEEHMKNIKNQMIISKEPLEANSIRRDPARGLNTNTTKNKPTND
jgi:hypothetical protein